MDKIIICLGISEKRLKVFDNNGNIFREKDINNDIECGGISDDIHYFIADNKIFSKYNITPWFRKLQKTYKDLAVENTIAYI